MVTSNETLILRPSLSLDREFGMYRNWWVRDPRIAGNPLSILLYLLSHAEGHSVSQTKAQEELAIGEFAWRAAKRKLMEAGFLIEIRDRYPKGPRGGQKRWSLILQDPEQGVNRAYAEAIIESDESLNLTNFTTGSNDSWKPRVDQEQSRGNHEWEEKPLISSTRGNHEWGKTIRGNHDTLIGRENQKGRKDIYINNPSIHSITRPSEKIGEIDQVLKSLAPELNLTFEKISSEVGGRVDLSMIDLPRVVQEVILNRKTPVLKPASYIATSIVKTPSRWLKDTPGEEAPFIPDARSEQAAGEAVNRKQVEAKDRELCQLGEHDWGHDYWPEHDRNYCVRPLCGTSRAAIDPAFAALLDEAGW